MGLVLASASPVRQQLLRGAGVSVTVDPAAIDEAALTEALITKGESAQTIATRLAEEKALAVLKRHPGEVVLGADSVLLLGSRLIGKSRDMTALKTLLRALSGKTHRLISAASLARDGRVIWRHAAISQLTMRPLSDAFLDAYLAEEGEVLLGSVGGYHFEGRGAQLFDSVEGDYFSILGLPLLPVLKELRNLGLLPS
jgi:septum formation protein